MGKKISNNTEKASLKTDPDFLHEIVVDTLAVTHDVDENQDPSVTKEAFIKTLNAIDAIGFQDGLQAMIASQMLSVHKLQREALCLAKKNIGRPEANFLTNAAIKLSNTFVQQASLLHKLQGNSNQTIVVKHVDVHDGGQAIVGNIAGGSGKESKEKK